MHKIPVHYSKKKIVKVEENQVLSAGLRPGHDNLKSRLSSTALFAALS
jgi:hypothetical protein